METALTVVQTPSEQQFTGQLFDLAKNTEDDSVKLIVALLNSPVVAMVAATALIEYLQGVEVYKGRKEWISQVGTHSTYYGKVYEPLISQPLATGLESVIISTEAIKSLGGIGDIAKIIGLFK